jgi:hypothetical protein
MWTDACTSHKHPFSSWDIAAGLFFRLWAWQCLPGNVRGRRQSLALQSASVGGKRAGQLCSARNKRICWLTEILFTTYSTELKDVTWKHDAQWFKRHRRASLLNRTRFFFQAITHNHGMTVWKINVLELSMLSNQIEPVSGAHRERHTDAHAHTNTSIPFKFTTAAHMQVHLCTGINF